MPKTGHFMLGFHIWRLRRGRGDHHSKMGLVQWRGHMPSLRDLGSDLLRQPSISMPKTGHFMLGFHLWRLRRGWPATPLGCRYFGPAGWGRFADSSPRSNLRIIHESNLPVGAQQIYIASELAPNTTGGTLSVSVRLPQRAFSFQEVNTTASAGSCTDRFVVGY